MLHAPIQTDRKVNFLPQLGSPANICSGGGGGGGLTFVSKVPPPSDCATHRYQHHQHDHHQYNLTFTQSWEIIVHILILKVSLKFIDEIIRIKRSEPIPRCQRQI